MNGRKEVWVPMRDDALESASGSDKTESLGPSMKRKNKPMTPYKRSGNRTRDGDRKEGASILGSY